MNCVYINCKIAKIINLYALILFCLGILCIVWFFSSTHKKTSGLVAQICDDQSALLVKKLKLEQ